MPTPNFFVQRNAQNAMITEVGALWNFCLLVIVDVQRVKILRLARASERLTPMLVRHVSRDCLVPVYALSKEKLRIRYRIGGLVLVHVWKLICLIIYC
jgi:hypothetical protein